MLSRQKNRPNWFQAVTVYAPGSAVVLECFEIQQSWDGSLKHHRRLRAACIEAVEKQRDRTGLEYIMWSPVVAACYSIPLADRQHVTVS